MFCRESIPDEPRLIARVAIFKISQEAPDKFLTIADAPYVISQTEWSFEQYTSAAVAAVQEDIKLNKIIYRLVPKRLREEEFWRLYFSKVLYIVACVKEYGVYPPPPPPPQEAPPPTVEAAPPEIKPQRGRVATFLLSSPDESCLLM